MRYKYRDHRFVNISINLQTQENKSCFSLYSSTYSITTYRLMYNCYFSFKKIKTKEITKKKKLYSTKQDRK